MASRSPSLGDIIRRQRELNQLTMKQLADTVGISNPYLSQIERGLRAPSERVLEAIAQTLQTTVDALHAQAGDGDAGEAPVLEALRTDPRLTARQRQALRDVYEAFAAQTADQRKGRR